MHILSLPFLNQRKGENDRRKYFMINLHEWMLPTSARVEPATSWSPVGRRIQLRYRGRQETICMKCQILFSEKIKKNISKCRLLKILTRVLSVKQPINNLATCVSAGWMANSVPANMYICDPYGQNLGIYPIRVLHGPHIGFFCPYKTHIGPILVKFDLQTCIYGNHIGRFWALIPFGSYMGPI